MKKRKDPCEGYRSVIRVMSEEQEDLANKVRCARSWFDQLASGDYGPEVAAFAGQVAPSMWVPSDAR